MDERKYSFNEALDLMKFGKKMTYGCVEGSLCFSIQLPDENSNMTLPYIFAIFKSGASCPTTFPNSAFFATDWVEVQV